MTDLQQEKIIIEKSGENRKNRVVEYLETNGSITSVADVAQQLGATRPSLSRVLSDMMDEGLVVKDGKGYRKA